MPRTAATPRTRPTPRIAVVLLQPDGEERWFLRFASATAAEHREAMTSIALLPPRDRRWTVAPSGWECWSLSEEGLSNAQARFPAIAAARRKQGMRRLGITTLEDIEAMEAAPPPKRKRGPRPKVQPLADQLAVPAAPEPTPTAPAPEPEPAPLTAEERQELATVHVTARDAMILQLLGVPALVN